MLKTRKRWISLVLTLAMLVAFCVPFVGPAAASTGYTALQVPTVSDDDWCTLGTVVAEISNDAFKEADDSVVVSLPNDFKFGNDTATWLESSDKTKWELSVGSDVYASVEATAYYNGNSNSLYNPNTETFKVEKLDDNQIRITVPDAHNLVTSNDAAYLKISLKKVYVDKGFDGDIKLNFDADSASGFPSADVVVGRVTGGNVTVSVTDDDTSNSDFTIKVRVKESKAGALEDDSDSTLKFVLPDGFKWNDPQNLGKKRIWGDQTMLDALSYTVDEDTLKLVLPKDKDSSVATCFELTLSFYVDDETKAEYGDVIAKISGDTDATPSEVKLGEYGDYNSTITAKDSTVVAYAGQDEQDISDINIKENLKGSLVDGRTITLTLPSNARWSKVNDKYVEDLEANESVADDAGVHLLFAGLQGENDTTLKLKIQSNNPSDKADIDLEDLAVNLEAGTTGDLKVTVGGSAGLTGELVVAKIVAPATITTSGKSDVKLGMAGQPIGDLIITEGDAGAISDDNNNIIVDLPSGVTFTTLPKVEVTSGDLDIDDSNVKRGADGSEDNNQLIIPILNDSNTASTIKISGIKLTVDRTVPEGDITVKLQGDDIVFPTCLNIWPNSKSASEVVAATVVTPAPGETKGTAVFTIGQASYTLNGTAVTMDAAPYIKDGRTFVPVRFAANAVGVADANIIWDGAAKKVTVIKGDRVVQMTIGSTTLLVNGASITMDVAPEIVNGRTMLPIRFLGQALGASFTWDEAAQTVTATF